MMISITISKYLVFFPPPWVFALKNLGLLQHINTELLRAALS